MKITHRFRIGIIGFCCICMACEGFVDTDPPGHQIVKEDVFHSDETAIAAMDGIYHIMYGATVFTSGSRSSVTAIAGFSADELEGHTSDIGIMEFYQNEVTITNRANLGLWSSAYNIIYMSNAILEGLTPSEGITDTMKKQLEGEAKFIRAFTYFYLVNLYGEVPLITTTSYKANALAARDSKNSVYTQIIQDLEEAVELLTTDYRTSMRTSPNTYAAMALLARVYLYLEEWAKAESYATKVIQETATYQLLEDLNSVYMADSREAIWQISPVVRGHTNEATTFILEGHPTFCSLTQNMVNAFESGDARFTHWIGSISEGTETFYYPYKYKVKDATGDPTEYSIVLRYAEQYLIRAEAQVQQNKLSGAITDLDVIRSRAGLPLISEVNPSIDQKTLLNATLQERRMEFFTEWGHRWLDLKRTGKVSEELSSLKPLWQTTDVIYPIPEQERLKNPNLTQNTGY